MDYGPNYFDDCPCITCKPPHSLGDNGSKKRADRSEEDIEQEKRKAKKNKRQRRKMNRKGGALP
jgi:hypothetical protein